MGGVGASVSVAIVPGSGARRGAGEAVARARDRPSRGPVVPGAAQDGVQLAAEQRGQAEQVQPHEQDEAAAQDPEDPEPFDWLTPPATRR
jgi:hypothetical protein